LPAIGDFFIGPELEGDKGDVDELLNTAILLECLEEATALLVLALDVVQQVQRLRIA